MKGSVEEPREGRGTSTGGVQSISRAFRVLEAIADHGGSMSLSDAAAASELPIPTIHRLVRTLVDEGYLRQDASREYSLAPKLIRLGESSSRALGLWARPYLDALVDGLEETANLAMLDAGQVVYVGQAPGKHSMRMFTEVGRRVSPHCTAVGKVLLAALEPCTVRSILGRTAMTRYTEHTITSRDELMCELDKIRAEGFATDNGEQEIGVRCFAVAVANDSYHLAISVSGPVSRMTDALLRVAVPQLQEVAAHLATEMGDSRGPVPAAR